MNTILPKIQKYKDKYKIFKPFLKNYLKENGYIWGSLILFKTVIGDGLRSIYRQLLTFKNRDVPKIATLEEAASCRYVIFAPDFVSNSAGIYCLYKLCHDLRQKGFGAGIFGSIVTAPDLDAPLITHKKIIKHLAEKPDVWVIYPETVVGNPLKFKNVARWVLNRPGVLGGDEVYHSDEKVFVYSNIYAPYVKNTILGKLNMPTFDTRIFYPPKEDHFADKRQLACYYIGKSTFKEGYFDPNETFEISRLSPPKKELGKLFRSAKILYSFDNTTALIYEAIACGCPVQIIPDGTQTWEDYEKLEWGTAGIFWDKPAVDLTSDEINGLLNKIKSTQDQYELELDNFINQTVGNRM